MTPWTVTVAARLFCPWGFTRPECWSGLLGPPPGDLPNPGIEPRSPSLKVDSLLSEPPGKPKNTGVVSLSLLQGNFPTQESNQDLLHCRRFLYQLSYLGSQGKDCQAKGEKKKKKQERNWAGLIALGMIGLIFGNTW